MFDWLGTQVDHWKRFGRVVPLLFEVRRERALIPILRSYLGPIPLCLFSEPFRWIRMLVMTRVRFPRPDQRPQAFFAPHLSANPFPAPNETSQHLERHASAIAEEFTNIPLEVVSPSIGLISKGNWNTFPLVRAAKPFSQNINLCKITWSVVEACPRPPEGVRGGVYFSILDPGTHITPHCGPSNLKHRYHLTIASADGARIRSGDMWRSWEPGKCLILDDSFEHEVDHPGASRRVVLIVDCWHSDLTESERDFLTRLHRRL